NQEKFEQAREVYQKANALDPKDLLPYFRLTRLAMETKDWQSAAKSAETLVKLDTRRRYPTVWMDAAVIPDHLGGPDGAGAAIDDGIRLDKKHELPRAEYVLGMILEARKDYTAAAAHMQEYLKLDPKAPDAAAVHTRIENLGKPESTDVAAELDVVVPNLP